jgi:ankyrin repeat protein
LLKANQIMVAQVDQAGSTALHIAAIYGNHDYASELLALGADLEAKDEEDLTPLYCAISFGHMRTVEFLLSVGACPRIRNKYFKTGESVLIWKRR